MPEPLVILDGSTFFVSDDAGDVEVSDEANGFFHADVRHLSHWKLTINGAKPRLLTTRNLSYWSARIFGTLAAARVGENPGITVRRDRAVSDGAHEDVYIDNNSEHAVRLIVEYEYDSDFADIFEVKERMPRRGRSWVEHQEGATTLWHEVEGFRRGTMLQFRTEGRFENGRARFDVTLAPRARWHLCIDISCLVGDEMRPPRARCQAGKMVQPQTPLSPLEWIQDAPHLESGWDVLERTYRQSLLDLAALRFRPRTDLTWSLPAAGLPWFMALFGRDSLITAYQALPFQRRLAQSSLEMLAATQADSLDDYRDSEPGKILHEIRYGKLASLRQIPHTPYYGSHDATPLFLILLDEYERWTGDRDFVEKLEPQARAAIAWLETYGDPDGDGYLEYRTRSPKGLENQGWKDSWNAILFADGSLAQPPIAVCEIQGYAYDARVRAARLASQVWDDQALADRLLSDAGALRRQFNRDFWLEDRGHYALALDDEKRPVDSLTSNVGHLLWSGIVDEERAPAIVARLTSPEMASGWGIRTMSNAERGYNPIEYHNGTVWPHDTVIVAEGMRRYGFRKEASELVSGLIEAAEAFSYRLPEVFAGFDRDETEIPVEYPTASRPQAWAAGAPLLAVRTLLGLDSVDGQLRSDPAISERVGFVRLFGIHFRGERMDMEAHYDPGLFSEGEVGY